MKENSRPLVSICCTTYNHKKYIQDALDSFLNQKTTFEYEIIVNDDASEDGTVEILREYEKKYNGKIKVIYHEENQYSQGKYYEAVKKMRCLAKGKYIAFCEGDDYWCDENKLEKQVDFLESNEKFIMCFHAVKKVDVNKKSLGEFIGYYKKGNRECNITDVAFGGIVHFSSVLIKSKYIQGELPEFYKNNTYDLALNLYIAGIGRIYYIDKVMSCYRVGVENSMMTKQKENYSVSNHIQQLKKDEYVLQEADKYFDYKYHKLLQDKMIIRKIYMLLLEKQYKTIFDKKNNYYGFIKKKGFVWFVKINIILKHPKICHMLVRLKNNGE